MRPCWPQGDFARGTGRIPYLYAATPVIPGDGSRARRIVWLFCVAGGPDEPGGVREAPG